MAYQVLVERAAEKDLRKITSEVRPCLVLALQSLAKNPRPAGSLKLSGSASDWRIRLGDYRIIYEIADEIRIVRINRVRHRGDVYR